MEAVERVVRLRVFDVDTQSEAEYWDSFEAQKGKPVWVRIPDSVILTLTWLRCTETQVVSASHFQHTWWGMPFDALFWYLQYPQHQAAFVWTVSFVDPVEFDAVTDMPPPAGGRDTVYECASQGSLPQAEWELITALFPFAHTAPAAAGALSAGGPKASQVVHAVVVDDGSEVPEEGVGQSLIQDSGLTYSPVSAVPMEVNPQQVPNSSFDQMAVDFDDNSELSTVEPLGQTLFQEALLTVVTAVINTKSSGDGPETPVGHATGQSILSEPPSSDLGDSRVLSTTSNPASPSSPSTLSTSAQLLQSPTRLQDFDSACVAGSGLLSYHTTLETTKRHAHSGKRQCRFAIEDMLDLDKLPRLLVSAIKGQQMIVSFGNLSNGQTDEQTFQVADVSTVTSFADLFRQHRYPFREFIARWTEQGYLALVDAIQLLCYCQYDCARTGDKYYPTAEVLSKLHKALLEIPEQEKSAELGLLTAVVAWCHDARRWFQSRNGSSKERADPALNIWEYSNPMLDEGKRTAGLLVTVHMDDPIVICRLRNLAKAALSELSDPQKPAPKSDNKKRKSPSSDSTDAPPSKRFKANHVSEVPTLENGQTWVEPSAAVPVSALSSFTNNWQIVPSSQNSLMSLNDDPMDMDSIFLQAELWNANSILK